MGRHPTPPHLLAVQLLIAAVQEQHRHRHHCRCCVLLIPQSRGERKTPPSAESRKAARAQREALLAPREGRPSEDIARRRGEHADHEDIEVLCLRRDGDLDDEARASASAFIEDGKVPRDGDPDPGSVSFQGIRRGYGRAFLLIPLHNNH